MELAPQELEESAHRNLICRAITSFPSKRTRPALEVVYDPFKIRHGAFAIRIVFVSPRECGVESLALTICIQVVRITEDLQILAILSKNYEI